MNANLTTYHKLTADAGLIGRVATALAHVAGQFIETPDAAKFSGLTAEHKLAFRARIRSELARPEVWAVAAIRLMTGAESFQQAVANANTVADIPDDAVGLALLSVLPTLIKSQVVETA